MISRKLVEQLDSLKAIKPRSEWKEQTRDILFAQISAQGSEKGLQTTQFGSTVAYVRGALIFSYRQTFEQLFARPLVLSGVLSVFVVMAVSAVVASQGSMPGDPLYTVKRTEESIRVAFISPADRPAFQMDIAGKRIKELSEISHKALNQEQAKEQKTRLAREANASISTAREDLLRLTKETPEQAVRVAAAIKEYAQKSAEQAKTVFTEENSAQSLADMIDGLDETKSAALAIIIEKKDSAKVPDRDIAEHLDQAIGELEERLAQLQSVSAAGFRDGADIEGASSEAKEILRSARESIERRDFKIALENISRSRGVIAGAEKKLRANGGDADTGENSEEQSSGQEE